MSIFSVWSQEWGQGEAKNTKAFVGGIELGTFELRNLFFPSFPNHNLPPKASQLFLHPLSVPLHPLLRSTRQSGCWSNHPDCNARQPRRPQVFLAVGNADCVTLAAGQLVRVVHPCTRRGVKEAGLREGGRGCRLKGCARRPLYESFSVPADCVVKKRSHLSLALKSLMADSTWLGLKIASY